MTILDHDFSMEAQNTARLQSLNTGLKASE
jgi:hypothetical protein